MVGLYILFDTISPFISYLSCINDMFVIHMLADPSWKFAAFIREPAERLLSAYLDKWKNSGLELEQNMWLYEFEKAPSFEEFINEIAKVCIPSTSV